MDIAAIGLQPGPRCPWFCWPVSRGGQGGFGVRSGGAGRAIGRCPARRINPEKLGGVYLGYTPQLVFWRDNRPFRMVSGRLPSIFLASRQLDLGSEAAWSVLSGDGRLRFPPPFARGRRMSRRLASGH